MRHQWVAGGGPLENRKVISARRPVEPVFRRDFRNAVTASNRSNARPCRARAAIGSVRDVSIPFAGRWHLRVDALATDFERITLEDEFDVPAR